MNNIKEQDFFAPSNMDMVDVLVEEYNTHVSKIKSIINFIKENQINQSLSFFEDNNNHFSFNIDNLFNQEKAIKNLDAYMWHRALQMTDVLDFMPAEKRYEWHNQINEKNVPAFTQENARSGISDLLLRRSEFLTDMVDGAFKSLSKEHVTNRPEGFSKRFIVDNMYQVLSYGLNIDTFSKIRYVNDIFFIVSKMMGRDVKVHDFDFSNKIHSIIGRNGFGQWVWFEGYSMRMRFYKKGTVHIEVHPDIAWRLNQILATRYPSAIPSKFTKKPSIKKKEHDLVDRQVPNQVSQYIDSFKRVKGSENYNFTNYSYPSKHVVNEGHKILEMIGGVKKGNVFCFEYDPTETLIEISCNGIIPDIKTHQFYPTPEHIAAKLIDIASKDINASSQVLEPSAGTGNLLKQLIRLNPKSINAVEISPFFSSLLKDRFKNEVEVTNIDFIKYKVLHDIIVMNPPFDQGRWKMHVQHALTLAPVVYSILPSGASCDNVGASAFVEHQRFNDEFDNCSVDVKIVEFKKG